MNLLDKLERKFGRYAIHNLMYYIIILSVLGKQLFDYVIAVASGEEVKSEKAGYHDMAIFKQGVTL